MIISAANLMRDTSRFLVDSLRLIHPASAYQRNFAGWIKERKRRIHQIESERAFRSTTNYHKPAGNCLIKCAYMVVLISGVLLKFLSKTTLGGNGQGRGGGVESRI